MRRLALIAAALWCLAVPGLAAQFVYELQLVGNGRVLARDCPVERGSVLLFHSYPNGTYTSVPRETVLRIEPRPLEKTVRPLQPGEAISIGPTGGEGRPDATASASRAGAQPNGNAYPYSPYGYGGGPSLYRPGGLPRTGFVAVPGLSPGTADVGVNGFPATGDLPRAASGAPPTIDTNGFPMTGPPATAIGPNGFPVSPGAPGSTAPNVGPNGFPAPPPGAPGSSPPPVGPNGFPAPAQPRSPPK